MNRDPFEAIYAPDLPFCFTPHEHGIFPVARPPCAGSAQRSAELCADLGVSRQTLYRYVAPKGALPPNDE